MRAVQAWEASIPGEAITRWGIDRKPFGFLCFLSWRRCFGPSLTHAAGAARCTVRAGRPDIGRPHRRSRHDEDRRGEAPPAAPGRRPGRLRRRGREKLHYLNPIPIRPPLVGEQVHRASAAGAGLNANWRARWRRCSIFTSARGATLGGDHDGDPHQVSLRRGRGVRLDARLPLRADPPRGRRPLAEGENLVVEPPGRLVQTMRTLWSEQAEREGTSRVTWEIGPVGDSCRLTVSTTSSATQPHPSSTAAGR